MKKSKEKYLYTIECHLRSYESQKEYQYIYNSWQVEKRKYQFELETIANTYKEYSLHDARHSEKIIENIERLLGEKRIRLLSPSDAWLILQCAYTHDLGMCVTEDEKYELFTEAGKNKEAAKKLLESKEFNDYIHQPRGNYSKFPHSQVEDPDFVALMFWSQFYEDANLDEKYIENVFGEEFSLANYYFGRIIEVWFREKHAERSRDKLLERLNEEVKKDSIPAHMRTAVAEINYCHGGGWERLDKLKRCQNGFNRDYMHPKFIAALLRMGDLLDMDSTRFNPYQLDYLSKISDVNSAYLLKDLSVSEILVSVEKICITANFRRNMMKNTLEKHKIGTNKKESFNEIVERLTSQAAKHMRMWMYYIRINAQEFQHQWSKIIPKMFPGNIAISDKLRILMDGVELHEKDNDLRYEISPKRSAEIIEGSGLYGTPLVFLRELIQNAIDATKIQIYRDLKNIGFFDSSNSSFIDFINKYAEVRNQYTVRVKFIFYNDENNISNLKIFIEDRGIGITKSRLIKMKHIGAIVDPQRQDEINRMPEWLKPTGDFGIGMQSVFLVADRFEIRMCPHEKSDDALGRIVFNSTRLGGDISYYNKNKNEEKNENFVTSVSVKINLSESVSFLQKVIPNSNVLNEQNNPFAINVFSLLKKECQKYLKEILIEELIPIQINFEEFESIENKPEIRLERIFPCKWGNSNIFTDTENKEIFYWHELNEFNKKEMFPTGFLIKYKNIGATERVQTKLYYRGIRFYEKEEISTSSVASCFEVIGYSCSVNIISHTARSILEINRERINISNLPELRKQAIIAFQSFLDNIIYAINEENQGNEEKQKLLKCISTSFYEILALRSLISGVKIKHQIKDICIKCTQFDLRSYSAYNVFIPFNEMEPENKLWYIDIIEHENIEILNLEKSRESQELEIDSINAIHNVFGYLHNYRCSRLIVFKEKTSEKFIEIYQLTTNNVLPEVDEYSYFLILNNIINENKKRLEKYEIQDDYFPSFPACLLKPLNNICEHISVNAPPIGADISEISYKVGQWLMSPLPMKHLKELQNKSMREKENLFEIAFEEKIFNFSYQSLIRFIRTNNAYNKNHSDEEIKSYLSELAIFLVNIYAKFG
ncbi:MAG: hypothetical protein FWG70_07655 [Oscillospiraceae bacterium]|nr:hypothetical protein [Oscillospiraceae bacterium]